MSHERLTNDREHQSKQATHPPPSQVEQTEALIGVIDHQAEGFERRLEDGSALSSHEIATARTALEQERSELQDHLLQLPPRSPTTTSAFRATDRISRLLERFDALDRAAQAKGAVDSESVHESPEDTLSEAERTMPLGYCDTAPQGVAPCQLDATRRSLYRRRIESDVQLATTNWVSALDSKTLSQRFKNDGITFEKKLGELVLGSLFGIIGIAANAAVHAGVDKGADMLAHRTELPNVPGIFTEPVAATDVAAAKKLGEALSNKALGTASSTVETSEQARPLRNNQQLASDAAHDIAVATDEDRFLEDLRNVPDKWNTNIAAHVDQLFDVDLAALALGLERAKHQLTVDAFKARIDTLLLAFSNQVSILDHRTDVRIIGVGMRDGTVRHALVEPERSEPKNIRRDEFAGTTVNTGNWVFLRWVNDDLNSAALEHARARDWSAGASIDAFDDGRFSEGRSFQLLADRRP